VRGDVGELLELAVGPPQLDGLLLQERASRPHRRELAELRDTERADAVIRLADAHQAQTGGLQRAVECGVVDAVIAPAATRAMVAAAFAAARPVRGLNANIPL